MFVCYYYEKNFKIEIALAKSPLLTYRNINSKVHWHLPETKETLLLIKVK